MAAVVALGCLLHTTELRMVHAAFRLLARSGARFACVAFQSSSARKYHPVLVGVLAAYLAYASRSRRGSILVRKWPPARDLEAALHLEECQYFPSSLFTITRARTPCGGTHRELRIRLIR